VGGLHFLQRSQPPYRIFHFFDAGIGIFPDVQEFSVLLDGFVVPAGLFVGNSEVVVRLDSPFPIVYCAVFVRSFEEPFKFINRRSSATPIPPYFFFQR
jgi:hypothetical protein